MLAAAEKEGKGEPIAIVPGMSLKNFSDTIYLVKPGNEERPFNKSWAVQESAKLKKPVLLVFWATWCAPCVSEAPELGKLSKTYPSTRFVGLVDDPNTPKTRGLVSSVIGAGCFGTHYFVKSPSIAKKIFKLADVPLPSFALFDPDGNLTSVNFSGSILDPKNRKILEEGLSHFEDKSQREDE